MPGITLGFNNTFDPAIGLFNTTNFPGASNAQLGDARAVYAMLTGRISTVSGQAALDPDTNQYVFLGPRRLRGLDQRLLASTPRIPGAMTPTLTLNDGLRWDLQTPFKASQRHRCRP